MTHITILLSRKKTEFIIFNFSCKKQENVKLMLKSPKIKRVGSFKYLGSVITSVANVDQNIMKRSRVC